MVNLRAEIHALKREIAQRFRYTRTRMRSGDDKFVIASDCGSSCKINSRCDRNVELLGGESMNLFFGVLVFRATGRGG